MKKKLTELDFAFDPTLNTGSDVMTTKVGKQAIQILVKPEGIQVKGNVSFGAQNGKDFHAFIDDLTKASNAYTADISWKFGREGEQTAQLDAVLEKLADGLDPFRALDLLLNSKK